MAKKLSKKQKQLVQKYTLLKRLGEGLILLGMLLPIAPFYQIIQAEIGYFFSPPNQKDISTNLDKLTYPIDEFRVVIPKIGVDAPIVSEVNSQDYNAYMEALKVGVAHAGGTAKPGEVINNNENVFLFAHSTLNLADVAKYNAIFIYLRKLEAGDKIDVIYGGKKWEYEIFEKKVVEATDLQYLTEPSYSPILTLQTCDPPGTNLRRLIIKAKLTSNNPLYTSVN